MIIISCLQRSKLIYQSEIFSSCPTPSAGSAGADLQAASPILRITIVNLFHHIY